MRTRFRDKVAIVTGAAQGMGRQVALDMAAEGANIVAVDIASKGIDSLLPSTFGQPRTHQE